MFERAKQGHAAVPQRQSDTANPRTLQEFNELKYKSKYMLYVTVTSELLDFDHY